jgi:IS30 family transposase
LSDSERDEIGILLGKGYSYEAIGTVLQRSKSSVWNEVRRNSVCCVYTPKKAIHKAYVRRSCAKYQGKKIVEHEALRIFVNTQLLLGQSPEAISGRLLHKHEKDIPHVSKESIYRYIKSVHGRSIESQLQKKKKRRTRKKVTGTVDGRTFIDERPCSVNEIMRIGDAEFDFIVSGKDGAGILLVVVDRKLRVAFIEPIYEVNIKNVHKAAMKIKARYPEWRTGTTDNDILFAKHKELGKLLGIKIFFCHPYHSWEKGTVENTNGEIRVYLPKGCDISKYTRKFFTKIEKKLNERFMKCLDFRTPEEALRLCRIQKKKREEVKKKKTRPF